MHDPLTVCVDDPETTIGSCRERAGDNVPPREGILSDGSIQGNSPNPRQLAIGKPQRIARAHSRTAQKSSLTPQRVALDYAIRRYPSHVRREVSALVREEPNVSIWCPNQKFRADVDWELANRAGRSNPSNSDRRDGKPHVPVRG